MTQQFPNDQDTRAAERAHDQLTTLREKLIEAATKDAQEAIKICLAINGGAAIAVLALMGSTRSTDFANLKNLEYSLFYFFGGVLATGLNSGCAYLANSLYSAGHAFTKREWSHPYTSETSHSKRYFKWGKRLNIAGVAFYCASIVLFVIGGLNIAFSLK